MKLAAVLTFSLNESAIITSYAFLIQVFSIYIKYVLTVAVWYAKSFKSML